MFTPRPVLFCFLLPPGAGPDRGAVAALGITVQWGEEGGGYGKGVLGMMEVLGKAGGALPGTTDLRFAPSFHHCVACAWDS